MASFNYFAVVAIAKAVAFALGVVIWVIVWGGIGTFAWEPVWRAVFEPMTVAPVGSFGQFAADFAKAMAFAGTLAGVAFGVVVYNLSIRWRRERRYN